MSEAPGAVVNEPSPAIKDLIDPRTISKNTDQEGRDKLASEVQESRQLRDEIKNTELKLDERQENLLVKIRQKLHIPDRQTIELQAQTLEQRTKQDQLPDPKKMIEAYYEKVAETPLTNQEKRDLLKPEVLSQLSTDEYIALWKRLNPYFLSHVTRQGFRDHNAMYYHNAGRGDFFDGFKRILETDKALKSPLASRGVSVDDEASVRIWQKEMGFLEFSDGIVAKKEFERYLRGEIEQGFLPGYQDKTAIHLGVETVLDSEYGAEIDNEIFFVFPTDIIASQNDFFVRREDCGLVRHPTEDRGRNDVLVWTSGGNQSISIDTGVAFLPKDRLVDPETGSKYASEFVEENGERKRVWIKEKDLIDSFGSWLKQSLVNKESFLRKIVGQTKQVLTNRERVEIYQEQLSGHLRNLGLPPNLSDHISEYLIFDKQAEIVNYESLSTDLVGEIVQKFETDGAFSRKMNQEGISAKDYWENFFSKNPNFRPKHIVYYNGNPTSAIYRFQQENGIGVADTSNAEGRLLGFDDRCVIDIESDTRASRGYQELKDLGNKIITEHYALK